MKTPRLEQLTRLVERKLERILPKASEAPHPIHEAMRYCVLGGGKRFRPLLCLGAAEAVGAPHRRALPIACAIELIHAYSLVHDDLPAMDNADTRRGKPSCHRQYGEANAILVGDALLTLSFELLSRNGTPNTLKIIRTIGEASGTSGLIGGQVLDLSVGPFARWPVRPLRSPPATGIQRPSRALHALYDVAKRKTAALITASVVAGGLAGGGRASQVERLRRYGQRVGLAFQVIDDVHDHEGLAQALGVDTARRKARQIIGSALEQLEPFGDRAQILRQLAHWLETTT